MNQLVTKRGWPSTYELPSCSQPGIIFSTSRASARHISLLPMLPKAHKARPLTYWLSLAMSFLMELVTNLVPEIGFSWNFMGLSFKFDLVSGWWFQPLWKILVSWGYYSQFMEKNVPNHQPELNNSNHPQLPKEQRTTGLIKCWCKCPAVKLGFHSLILHQCIPKFPTIPLYYCSKKCLNRKGEQKNHSQ